MPKAKGMTSIEIAIIVAIILVIAVAVGWYLYTTFTASTQAQARLTVASATYFTNGTLTLIVSNPGPVEVTIQSIYLAGTGCDLGTSGGQGVSIGVGTTTPVKAECSVTATPGSMLQGQVITTAGTSFPFTASVLSAQTGTGGN